MNIRIQLGIAAALVLLSISCSISAPAGAGARRASVSIAGSYVFNELAYLKIRLVIRPDGTYEASSEEKLAPVRRESGIWEVAGEDMMFHLRNGGLQHPIQRLRLAQEVPGRLIWIVPVGNMGGAITYFSFHRQVHDMHDAYHALQLLTRPSHQCCNLASLWAGSLSLRRWRASEEFCYVDL
jgi:hypothetical protein